MKKYLLLQCIMLLFGGFAIAQPPTHELWRKVWSDEFNGINSDLDTGWNSDNGGYASTSISCSRWRKNAVEGGGVLRLYYKKETTSGTSASGTWQYDWTAAQVSTKRKFKYGYFESRFKVADVYGTNNSFWLISSQNADPNIKKFEIDINEGWPSPSSSSSIKQIRTNTHNWSDIYINASGKETHPTSGALFNPSPWYSISQQYHTMGLEWNENELIWYLDGNIIRRSANVNGYMEPVNCFDYAPVLLSGATLSYLGITLPDNLDGKFMEVDWVRVYERVRPPAIQPTCVNGTAMLFTGAGLPGTTTYRWEASTFQNGVYNTWVPLNTGNTSPTNPAGLGATYSTVTNDTLFISNIPVALHNARYRCLRTNVYSGNTTTSYSDTITLSVNSAMQVQPIVVNTPAYLGSTVRFDATVSGGSGNYSSYTWSGPSNFSSNSKTPFIPNFAASNNGTYTLLVSDTGGCSKSATVTINAGSSPNSNINIQYTGTTTTAAFTAISLSATVSGGSGVYTQYRWVGPNNFVANTLNASIASATTAMSGVYTLFVTDNTGFVQSVSTTVTVTKISQTINFTAISNLTSYTGSTTRALTATTTSGLPVRYESSNTRLASLVNATTLGFQRSRPDYSFELSVPISTTKVRIYSTQTSHFHIKEFRLFAPTSLDYPQNVLEDLPAGSPLVNLAEDAAIAVSGSFSSTSWSSFAVDNNVSTGWISQPSTATPAEKWIELSFPNPVSIGCVQFVNGFLSSGTWQGLMTNFVVQYWNGTAWQSINDCTVRITAIQDGNENVLPAASVQHICVDSVLKRVTAVAMPPVVTMPTVENIGTTSALLGANVLPTVGSAITAKGTVYDVAALPTANALTAGNTLTGVFTQLRTGLTPNTIYWYRGYATNSAGTGYTVDSSAFTTLSNAPTSNTPTTNTASSFTARWSAPVQGAAPYTYTLQVVTDAAFSTNVSTIANIASSATSRVVSGLQSNTVYYYRVGINNASGSSAWSAVQTANTCSAAPTVAAASNIGTVRFTANWTAPTNAGNLPITYQVQYSTDGVSWTGSTTVSSINATSFTIGNLLSNQTYYYRVRAINAGGNSVWSAAQSVTTELKQKPAVLFETVNDKFIGEADFNPASASLSQPTVLSTNNAAVASIVDGKIRLLAAGTVTITATTTETDDFYAADPKSITFSVFLSKPFVTNNVPGTIECENFDIGWSGGAYFDVDANLNNNLYRATLVDLYSITTNPPNYRIGSIANGEYVHYTINVTESANYQIKTFFTNGGAVDVPFTLTIDNGTAYYLSARPTLNWSTYDSSLINGVYLSSGTHVIKVTFTGVNTFGLDKMVILKPQTLSFPNVNQTQNVDAITSTTTLDPALAATASSGLPITYTSSNTNVAVFDAATGNVRITGRGQTILTAMQLGNNSFAAATNAVCTLTVMQNQVITFNTDRRNRVDKGTFVPATVTSGGALTLTSSKTSVATVSGNQLVIADSGNTVITATQAADLVNFYNSVTASYTLRVWPTKAFAANVVNGTANVLDVLQAEDYDIGGPGCAYNDATIGNNGNASYRNDSVDIATCADLGGGFKIQSTSAGEWLKYTINVSQTGTYDVAARVTGGAQPTPSQFRIEMDDVPNTNNITVGNDNWNTFRTLPSGTFALSAGIHTMRLFIVANTMHFNYFTFNKVSNTGPAVAATRTATNDYAATTLRVYPNPAYSRGVVQVQVPVQAQQAAQLVVRNSYGKVVHSQLLGTPNSRMLQTQLTLPNQLSAGVYLVQVVIGNQIHTTRLVVQ